MTNKKISGAYTYPLPAPPLTVGTISIEWSQMYRRGETKIDGTCSSSSLPVPPKLNELWFLGGMRNYKGNGKEVSVT